MSATDSDRLIDDERTRVQQAEALGKAGAQKVSELLPMLADSSWVVRRAVVKSLIGIGDEATHALCEILLEKRDNEARVAAAVDALADMTGDVETLVHGLAKSPNSAVVADAAQILGRRKSGRSVPILVDLIQHADDNVAVGAVEALGRIGGRAAVEALIDAVRSENFFRVFPAIDVLGRSGDPRAVEPLTALLKNPNYLPEAARALGKTGEKSALRPLILLLKSSSDAIVRIAAASILELRDRFEDKAGAGTDDFDELIRSQTGPETVLHLGRLLAVSDSTELAVICQLLGAIGSADAAPMLTKALDFSSVVASTAAEALKSIGKGTDEPLILAIREGSSARRKALLPVISQFHAAVEVANCLKDADREVRAIACEALARLGNTTVVAQLFPLLEDSNMRVVHAATAAIQALGSRTARELAVHASESQSPVVRRSALRILAYFGDDSSLEPMLKGLKDPDSRVREAALHGLPYLENPLALEALVEAIRSDDARTRALAMRSLGQVAKAGERVLSLLLKGVTDSDSWVRYYACQSMGRLEFVSAANEIAKLLKDDAGQVRVSAVEALSHLDSPVAYEALREAALSEEIEMRRAAIVGLGISHRSEDLAIVLAAAESADVSTRLMALSALVRFSSALVVGALAAASKDPDEQISITATGFLAARPEQEATIALVELLSVDKLFARAKAALLVSATGRLAGLLAVLETASEELAPLLISIISRMERADSRRGLLAAFKLTNVAARKAAATGLAARKDPEILSVLRDSADYDPNQDIRQICLLLLNE